MTSLEIVVSGRPAPQGSKRTVGRGRMVEMSRYLGPWRAAVQAAAARAMAATPGAYPLPGAIVARMVFTVERPRGHYGTGRNANRVRPSAPNVPAAVPDLSKLVRSTEDALTIAGVWADDARVVDYTRLAKVYPGRDPEALDEPGVRITIHQYPLTSVIT